jgi:dephospho-CoA kinase
MAPLKIGLTGGIAAGKSEALAAFGRLGAATISSDAIVHELLGDEPMTRAIAERWGEDLIVDGAVDRARVGEIVFADPQELAWLEAAVHPLVGARIASWLESLPDGTPAAVIEVPLLFETEMEGLFDATVSVHSSDEVRRARAAQRGHTMVEERETRHLRAEEKARRADHVVSNDGTIEELEAKLSALVESLTGSGQAAGPDQLQQ